MYWFAWTILVGDKNILLMRSFLSLSLCGSCRYYSFVNINLTTAANSCCLSSDRVRFNFYRLTWFYTYGKLIILQNVYNAVTDCGRDNLGGLSCLEVIRDTWYVIMSLLIKYFKPAVVYKDTCLIRTVLLCHNIHVHCHPNCGILKHV